MMFKRKQTIVSAGGMVFNENDEFLIVHPTGFHPSEYRLPKGRVNDGESYDDAALREVEEETGFHCQIVNQIAKTVKYPSRLEDGTVCIKKFKCFLMTPIGRTGTGDWENDEELWVNISNYKSYLLEREIPVAEAGLRLWFKLKG